MPARATTKKSYHHGDLREALIKAAFEEISQSGAEGFTMADACRIAGVSTAAPYRHFKDRDELLADVTALGFQILHARDKEACEAAGEGTVDGIIALGKSYVGFAVDHPGLFRLMFGQNPKVAAAENVELCGHECFSYVIGQVALYFQKNDRPGNPLEIATSLWTYVHGMSSLSIDRKYETVSTGIDVEKLLEDVTPRLLGQ